MRVGEGEEGGGGEGRGGERIKSCQREILGFKRSETGVKGFASLTRLYVMLIGGQTFIALSAVSPCLRILASKMRRQHRAS